MALSSGNGLSLGGGTSIPAPVNSVLPVISGTTSQGQTLSCTTGTWSGSPTYTYAWKRGGVAIGGATASTYLLTVTDVGTMITCTVTATNAGGSTAATATGVGPIAGLPVATFVSAIVTGGNGAAQTFGAIDLSGTVDQTICVGLAEPYNGDPAISTFTVTPNGGSPISGVPLYQPTPGGIDCYISWWRFALPANTSGADASVFVATYSSNPFATGYRGVVWSIPASDLVSLTPTDTKFSQTTGTSESVGPTTLSGGVILAMAKNRAGAGSCAWTGSAPPVEVYDSVVVFGPNFSAASASGTSAAAPNTVTATFTDSGDMCLSVITLR